MAHRKAGGSASNFTDSNPQYLGVKRFDGQIVEKGNILIRQRGLKYRPGINVSKGKDDTLFAMANGKVKFSKRKVTNFTGKSKMVTTISVI